MHSNSQLRFHFHFRLHVWMLDTWSHDALACRPTCSLARLQDA